MSLDRITGPDNLYIGGLFTLYRTPALKEANITHVVSALRLSVEEGKQDKFAGFKHLVVEVDDAEDENIIEQFPRSNAFIKEGLEADEGKGGVFVHCAMGKSRSTTLIIAHLLSTRPHLTPQTALSLIQQTRPFAEPNNGFMSQLSLYHKMHCPSHLDDQPEYQRWLYRRAVETSNAAGVAPDVAEMVFGDENTSSRPDSKPRPNPNTNNDDTDMIPLKSSAPTPPSQDPNLTTPPPPQQSQTLTTFRCRRCRRTLANSTHLLPHPSPPPFTPSSPPSTASSPSQKCTHHHLSTPLTWMRPELSEGKLDGRLECPNEKCRALVGRYAWQGLRCSCGEWVVPGLALGGGKVDEIVERGGVGVGVGGRGGERI